jgi:hypothetical protein
MMVEAYGRWIRPYRLTGVPQGPKLAPDGIALGRLPTRIGVLPGSFEDPRNSLHGS